MEPGDALNYETTAARAADGHGRLSAWWWVTVAVNTLALSVALGVLPWVSGTDGIDLIWGFLLVGPVFLLQLVLAVAPTLIELRSLLRHHRAGSRLALAVLIGTPAATTACALSLLLFFADISRARGS